MIFAHAKFEVKQIFVQEEKKIEKLSSIHLYFLLKLSCIFFCFFNRGSSLIEVEAPLFPTMEIDPQCN